MSAPTFKQHHSHVRRDVGEVVRIEVDHAGYGDDSGDVALARLDRLTEVVSQMARRLPYEQQAELVDWINPAWERVE